MSYKEEFVTGLEALGKEIRSVDEATFFLAHGHHVASDEGKWDEFFDSFPNFFGYSFTENDLEEMFG